MITLINAKVRYANKHCCLWQGVSKRFGIYLPKVNLYQTANSPLPVQRTYNWRILALAWLQDSRKEKNIF